MVSVKAAAKAKFDETVEIIVELGVDPRKPNQNIRNTAQVISPVASQSWFLYIAVLLILSVSYLTGQERKCALQYSQIPMTHILVNYG